MTLLDEVGKKITRTSQDMAKKAKDIAEIGNLKLQKKEEYWKLTEAYQSLGEKYFAIFGENVPAELRAEVEKVETLRRKLSILEERIANLKSEKECPGCGKKLDETANYCAYCGEKYPEKDADEEAAEVEYHSCSGCGAQVMEEEIYCTKCGKKQTQEEPVVPQEEEVADVVEEQEIKTAEKDDSQQ